MKQVGGAFKIDMAQYFELQAFSQFAADIGPETQVRLARGVRLITLLTQDAGNTLSIRQQVQTLCLSNQDSFVVMSTPQLKRLCGLLQTVPEWLSIVIPITAHLTWHSLSCRSLASNCVLSRPKASCLCCSRGLSIGVVHFECTCLSITSGLVCPELSFVEPFRE